MAEFKEVMKQKNRMCDKFKSACNRCKLYHKNNGTNETCTVFCFENPQEAEEIIMKWAKDNPMITNADKFREVFGVEIQVNDCYGFKCELGVSCHECSHNKFWEKEYKG